MYRGDVELGYSFYVYGSVGDNLNVCNGNSVFCGVVGDVNFIV